MSSVDPETEFYNFAGFKNYELIVLDKVSQSLLTARAAIFLTAFYNYDENWPLENVSNPPFLEIPESLEAKQTRKLEAFRELYSRINKKLQLKLRMENDLSSIRNSLNIVHDRACSLIPFLIDDDKEKMNVQSVRDQLTSPLASCEHEFNLINLAVRDKKLTQDELLLHLQTLTKELKLKQKNLAQQQTSILRKWCYGLVGTVNQTPDGSHVSLRLMSSIPNVPSRIIDTPLIRACVENTSLETLMLTNIQTVCYPDYIKELSVSASAALTPSIMVASIQLCSRVDLALADDLGRLSLRYPLDWNSSTRQLHLLTGPIGSVLATIHIAPNGFISLIQLKRCVGNQAAEKILEDVNPSEGPSPFLPPLSWSLDDWLMEICDFCNA